MKNKLKIIECLLTKILASLMLIVGFLLPFSILCRINNWDWNLLYSELFLIPLSWAFIRSSYLGILTTNNPADRKNYFSLNKRFNGRLKNPGMITLDDLQQPTNIEVKDQKIKIRKKKLSLLRKRK